MSTGTHATCYVLMLHASRPPAGGGLVNNMSEAGTSLVPPERKPSRGDKAESGAVVALSRAEVNESQADNVRTSGDVSVSLRDRPDDRAGGDGAKCVSPAEHVAPATNPRIHQLDHLMPSEHRADSMKPLLPEDGEGRGGDQGQDRLGMLPAMLDSVSF